MYKGLANVQAPLKIMEIIGNITKRTEGKKVFLLTLKV
jgi:hypothetical protein